ncbi:MAG: cyclase family protein [Anaerolineales bacterium]|nr:cyclase family protein [Anaerolineales bacterium]
MKIYDISLTMSPGMPVWPGDPPVALTRVASMDEGAHANLTHLACSAHTGTHVDAPHHFLNDRRTVEGLPLEVLTGPACLVRIPDQVTLITAAVLEAAAIPAGTERLLLKTANSALWGQGAEFFTAFVGVSEDGAAWLVRSGIRLIGVDYLSVAPYKQGVPTHRALLAGGVVIVEGLDLRAVEPGEYALYCLPLKLAGSDGAPARAILVG